MHVIIDGYNVIFKDRELARLMDKSQLEQARNELVARVSRYQASTSDKVTVVFDGVHNVWSDVQHRGQIRIRYSRRPQKADNIIMGVIRDEANPGGVKVVSSDNEIRSVARAYSARVMKAEEFLEALDKLARKESGETAALEPGEKFGKKISKREVESWMKVFKDIKDEL